VYVGDDPVNSSAAVVWCVRLGTVGPLAKSRTRKMTSPRGGDRQSAVIGLAMSLLGTALAVILTVGQTAGIGWVFVALGLAVVAINVRRLRGGHAPDPSPQSFCIGFAIATVGAAAISAAAFSGAISGGPTLGALVLLCAAICAYYAFRLSQALWALRRLSVALATSETILASGVGRGVETSDVWRAPLIIAATDRRLVLLSAYWRGARVSTSLNYDEIAQWSIDLTKGSAQAASVDGREHARVAAVSPSQLAELDRAVSGNVDGPPTE
jgi:hypothetical protein